MYKSLYKSFISFNVFLNKNVKVERVDGLKLATHSHRCRFSEPELLLSWKGCWK